MYIIPTDLVLMQLLISVHQLEDLFYDLQHNVKTVIVL